MPAPEAVNPYVGPYAFAEKDASLFFGRDREADALLSLVIAERVSVLCSPSGAGKSSLVHARLVPDLRQRGFSVLPVARVSGEAPAGVAPDNVYVYSVLSTLSGDGVTPSETLAAFLNASRWAEDEELLPRVLIIDQLEEIVTTHPDRWRDRTDFFVQLRRALLDDPALSVLLVLREDHLAGLDPWAHLLPGQLRTRLRIERLRREDALDAVRRPAEAAGRPFAPGIAEALVDDLSQLHLAGREETVAGELVEPVQLQVVCFQLWENLRRKPGGEITALDLLDSGDIDRALESFYESAVKRAAATGVSESLIRHWCGTRLITPTRVRAQVARDAEVSWGLPNAAVDALVDAHLIRAEAARGGIWYELAHDRFIEPVLASNKRAAPEVVRRLGKDARAWRDKGKEASYLYRGEQLSSASSAVAELRELLPPAEREFLAAAENEEAALRARGARRLRGFVTLLCTALATSAALSVALYGKGRQSHSSELAAVALLRAQTDPDLGLRLALEAAEIRRTPEAEAALHQTLRLSEVRRRGAFKIAPDTASIVAVHPDGRRIAAVGIDGQLAIRDTASDRRVSLPLETESAVTAVAFDRDGKRLASGYHDGRVALWNADSGALLGVLAADPPVNAVAFSPDASRLAVATGEPDVPIWDLATRQLAATLSGGHGGSVWDVAWNADGTRVATAGDDGRAVVWSTSSGRPVWTLVHSSLTQNVAVRSRAVRRVAFGAHDLLATAGDDFMARIWRLRDPGPQVDQSFLHAGEVWDVAFHPDGRHLATASADGLARLWDLVSGVEVRTIHPGSGQVRRIAFSGRGDLVTAAVDAPVGELRRNGSVVQWTVAPPPAALARAATVLGFVRGGRQLVTVDPGGWLHLRDLAGRAVLSTSLGELPTEGLAFAAAENRAALGLSSGTVEIVDLAAKTKPFSFSAHSGPITGMALSPDGRLLATTGEDDATSLWDLTQPVKRLQLAVPRADAPRLAAAWSPDGAWLAACDIRGAVHLWPIRYGAALPALRRLEGTAACRDLAISPDSRQLASGGEDGSLTLWQLATGRQLATLRGHTGEVTTVAYSPDGRLLASAGTDGTARLWNVAERREIFALPVRPVADLAFTLPDADSLAIVDKNAFVSLEPLRWTDLINRARERRPRALSAEECRFYLRRSWLPWLRECAPDKPSDTSGGP